MLRPSLQTAAALHCAQELWTAQRVDQVCRGVFQASPDFQLIAVTGAAQIPEPALRAARKAGFISEVRMLVPERAADLVVVGPSRHMVQSDWEDAVSEMARQLNGTCAMIGAEVWVADDELSALSLMLGAPLIRAQFDEAGFDIPDETDLRARLDERRCLYPSLLEYELDAEVQKALEDVA